MEDTFYFLEAKEEKIQNQQFLCIYVLNFDKHVVLRIFKKYTKELDEKFSEFAQFEDISEKITFAIKRDGKISLDIDIK